jgi:hypothetical protein
MGIRRISDPGAFYGGLFPGLSLEKKPERMDPELFEKKV